jgi:hypothetical protein
MRLVLGIIVLLLPVSVLAQSSNPNAGGFLEPYQSNAYGPNINSDATGRPFSWQPLPGNGPADPLSEVRPDAYGPGIGMDQYGRPVEPGCPQFQQSC